MKKILSYILITVIIIANLFAPISVGWNKNNIRVEKNTVSAASTDQIGLKVIVLSNDTSITAKVEVHWADNNTFTKEKVSITLLDGDKKTVVEDKTVTDFKDDKKLGDKFQTGTVVFTKNIKSEHLYYITSIAMQVKPAVKLSSNPDNLISPDIGITGRTTPIFLPIATRAKGLTKLKLQGVQTSSLPESSLPICQIVPTVRVGGCFAQLIYWALFIPSSYLFALSGTFFDYTFNYSVQSSSYQSTFVVQGWGLVRDFVNMFFIFVLLYIAFSTILNLNGAKTKEMIINVIIIGLLINFSLFAVRLVIDTSNILARVFYNSNAIKITQVKGPDASKLITKLNKNGVIPLSAALVNKINPQSLIINARKVGDIPDKAGQTNSSDNKKNGVTTWAFIIVTLLAVGVNIVGFVVFLSVGMIFIIRVVGLWIAMILAPIAFFSYTVPAMQNIEMVGWKKWWPDLLKLAFLAPVFIFFIYLILQFLNTGFGLPSASSKNGLSFVIAIVLPFAFIMVLLMKAKSIAVKMSGDMGKAVAKIGSSVGGLALGAVTGGAAMAMRAGVGRVGSAIANSERVKKMASSKSKFTKFLGNKTMDAGQSIGKKSFDLRNTKLGAEAGKGLGVDFGKGKTGGFDKAKADQIAKDEKRAQELKVGDNNEDKKDLNKAEEDRQELLTENKETLDKFDKDIEEAGNNLRNVSNQFGSGSEEAKEAGLKLTNTKARKKAFIEGEDYEGDIAGYEQMEIGKKKVKKTRKVNKPIESTLVDEFGNKIMKDNYVDEEYEDEESIMGNNKNKPIRNGKNKRSNSNINAGDARDKNGNFVYRKDEDGKDVYEKDKDGKDVYEKDKDGKDVYEKDKDGKDTNTKKRLKIIQKRTIDYLEKTEIKKAREIVVRENKKRTTGYASNLDSMGSKAVNFIFSGGQYSGTGANTAAHNIRMDQEIDTGKKV